MKKSMLVLMAICVIACSKKTEVPNQEALKAEIFKVEDDFKKMAQVKGIQEAFYAFAADDAVMKRDNDSLIEGKEAIRALFADPKFKKATVTWKPDFVDVSDDGTLAYTYGRYVWTTTDSLGAKQDFKGRFHTVWKRQKDGSWKFVWD